MSTVTEQDERRTGQVAPDELVHEFGALLTAATVLERIVGRELERRCGIRHAVFEVLLKLASAGDRPLAMGDLAGELILTSGGMTRIVDRMEDAALVRREPAPGDRRRQLVELTPKGRAKLDEALRVHAETLREHFAAPLTGDQRRVLVDALHTLGAQARKELGDLH
ncbi:MarR family winged helix-turn-helix transcriptional regulator [Actinomadura meridiana]|uniref:MarR family winged helix-turn-helix transcriptional regulator n=1 Tax=Actinomadura meridiana TaxID=559626 RepID=A0ABP8C0Q1_9ACTN